mgnify:CR=1 FL=1
MLPVTPTAVELVNSREVTYGDPNGLVARYRVDAANTHDEAVTAVISLAPTLATVQGQSVVRQNIRCIPKARRMWEAEVTYGERKANQIGDWKLSWDTTAVQEKITQSYGTRKVSIAGSAADYNGAIGVVKSGSSLTVEGCQIYVPKFAWQITYCFPAAAVTPSMAVLHHSLTGKTNSGYFWGFQPGECLFLGGTGATGSTGKAEVTLRFLSSPHASFTTAGANIEKRGWEYVWFSYQDAKDSEANIRIQKPLAAYLETVYLTANLGMLGIGA